jgi:periplasmic divalent cation tolerance protein
VEFAVVLVTVPNREVGLSIAEALVAERLAACANLVPGVFSIYRWQGQVEREAEELLVLKTRSSLVEALGARVRALHPYTVPEIVALPVAAGSEPYLQWLQAETLDDPAARA